MFRRRIAVIAVASVGALGLAAAPALAGDYCPPKPPPEKKQKCNSGNGNGSDAITFVVGEHCFGGDPGNAFSAGDKGGDEIPTSGGVPNPGGNNDPG